MKIFTQPIKNCGLGMLLSFSILSGAVFAESPIDPTTGLVIDKGFELVRAHCTACHSGKLVSQNKMSRQSWLSTIRWMQKTQGLWPLGDAEPVILDYLVANYHPVDVGRRPPLAENLMPVSPKS